MYKLNSMTDRVEGRMINWTTHQKKSLKMQHRRTLCHTIYGKYEMRFETFKVDET